MICFKLILVLAVYLASSHGYPAINPYGNNYPQVVRYDIDNSNMPNSYKFFYENSDGGYRTERGDHVYYGGGTSPDSPATTALQVLGESRWVTDDGVTYVMTYSAGPRGSRTKLKRLNIRN